MTNFNWQMEDEDTWDDEVVDNKSKKKRPSLLFPLLIIAAVALSAGGIYSLVNRQLEGAGQEIKADVLRTHELVLDAADSGDVELFTTFLSGIDYDWVEQQRQRVERERFDQAQMLGIELLERPLQIDEITLAPTLDEATVTYTRWYSGAGVPEIGLQHVAVYRRGEDRWLLAPPAPEFWGEESSVHEGALTLIYPERDETKVLQLADDLSSFLPEICQQIPGSECPAGWRLRVELSTNPETLLEVNQLEGGIDSMSIHLPTPSLLGLPVDAAGYEALSQSYQQFLERRVTAAFTLWMADNPSLVPPLLFVRSPQGDFVASEPSDFFPDLDMTFSCSTGTAGLQSWGVFRYGLQTGQWSQVFQREYQGSDSGFVVPLSGDGDSFIVQEYLRDDLLTARLLLMQGDRTMIVAEEMVNFDNALAAPFFLRETDPSGRYLLIGKSVDVNGSWYLLDREMCLAGQGCTMQPIIGMPLWSPDGRQMIMQEPPNTTFSNHYRKLYLADGPGQEPVEIGRGASPFWIDENTYGYSRVNGQGQMELVLADGESSWVVLDGAALQAQVPETESRQWNQITVSRAWANVERHYLVLMTTPTTRDNSGPYDYFLVHGDGDEPEIKWLFSSDFPATNDKLPGSPDGRYLMLTQRGTTVYFYDLDTGLEVPFDNELGWAIDWSPDGRFYVQWQDEAMTLTDPSSNFQAQLVYDFSTCLGLEWFAN